MILWTAFLLGLVGSLHCLGMCGPLTLLLPRLDGPARMRFVAGRVAYNSGRLVTYSILGIAVGALGSIAAFGGLQRALSISLGIAVIVGVLFGRRLAASGPINSLVSKLRTRFSKHVSRNDLPSMFVVGIINGLLPCGLVYAGLAIAASVHTPLYGAATMAVFGLGTFPLMLAVSLSGGFLGNSFRIRLQRLIPTTMCLMGVLLVLRGMSLGIPYLSPAITNGTCSCH